MPGWTPRSYAARRSPSNSPPHASSTRPRASCSPRPPTRRGSPTTDNREFAESDLSRALRAVVDQPGFRDTLAGRQDGAALLDDLDAAVRKVGYARQLL